MTESYEDQLSRVRMMATPVPKNTAPTWDLSPNDQAALRAVLESHHEMRELLSTALEAYYNRPVEPGDWPRIQLHRAWFDEAIRLTEERGEEG